MRQSIANRNTKQNVRIDQAYYLPQQKLMIKGFPGGAVVKNLPDNAGDTGSSPGLGRSHMPRSN